jgi:hypothetical protein
MSDVKEFFALVAQPWWLDRNYVPDQAAAMLRDDGLIRLATLDQVRAMLTYCVRWERFSDGHWDDVLRTGRVAALLRRLQVLRWSL